MPRYYFHIAEGDDITEDDEGLELADLAAAKHEAHESIRELAIQRIEGRKTFDNFELEIRDELGSLLDRIHVREVLGQAAAHIQIASVLKAPLRLLGFIAK